MAPFKVAFRLEAEQIRQISTRDFASGELDSDELEQGALTLTCPLGMVVMIAEIGD